MDELIVCGGCNAKIAPGKLSDILKDLQKIDNPNILVGSESCDDAAVIKLNEEQAIIQTVDFFPPMVNDPFLFGQIAAANALSDVYAMGGNVISALNIVAFPEQEDLQVLKKILAGGLDKVKEAKADIVGGHSIHDQRIKYGLSVCGIINPNNIWKNNAVQIGDCLLLSKPIGVGIINAAKSVDMVNEKDYQKACNNMALLNKYARDIMINYDVHACSDITGFGLAGHLKEMMGDNHCAHLYKDDIPVLDGAYEASSQFIYTVGGQKNRNFLGEDIKFLFNDPAMEEIIFDPQTSGGLLFSVNEKDVEDILKDFEKNNVFIQKIGKVEAKENAVIIVE